jgi:hypothetical protein
MKLFITGGGCRFLGSNLASDALAIGDELVAIEDTTFTIEAVNSAVNKKGLVYEGG